MIAAEVGTDCVSDRCANAIQNLRIWRGYQMDVTIRIDSQDVILGKDIVGQLLRLKARGESGIKWLMADYASVQYKFIYLNAHWVSTLL